MLGMAVDDIVSYFKKLDWVLIGAVGVLSITGLLAIFSASPIFFKKQSLFILIGFFLMFALSFLDFRIFKNHSSILVLLFFLTLGILVLVLFWGRTVRGTTAWFHFGKFDFQPVELAKLVSVLILAKYFSQRHIEMYRVQHIIISGLYIFLPAFLVILQPDLGSVLILITIWMGLIILAGIKLRHLLFVLLIGLIISISAWFLFLKDYQKERILTFLNPQKDPLGYSYTLNQSLIAIGSGQIFGKGLGQGTQTQLNFLPEKHSDFIFASFAEEWGFIGVLFLLVFFGLLFYRLIRVSLLSTNNFARIFAAGVALIFFSQIIINLGMNMGLLPITGIPLPFISYGGSNLIINFAALGIIQSIIVRENMV